MRITCKTIGNNPEVFDVYLPEGIILFKDDKIKKDGRVYAVVNKVYDDDLGEVYYHVQLILSFAPKKPDNFQEFLDRLEPISKYHIQALLKDGNKLAAVKFVKEALGEGLKESKEFVDYFETQC